MEEGESAEGERGEAGAGEGGDDGVEWRGIERGGGKKGRGEVGERDEIGSEEEREKNGDEEFGGAGVWVESLGEEAGEREEVRFELGRHWS